MEALSPIYRAYEEGSNALILDTRRLYDVDADDEGKIRPLREGLRKTLRERYGMVLLEYSISGGLEWNAEALAREDRRVVEDLLRDNRLLGIPQDENEVARILRGLSNLLRTPVQCSWPSDKRAIQIALLVDFPKHLTPAVQPGSELPHQVVAIEVLAFLGTSLALRKANNLVVLNGGTNVAQEISDIYRRVDLQLPDADAKKRFLGCALVLYTRAKMEVEVNDAAFLLSRTPNRGQEELIRAAHKNGSSLSAAALVEQKARDIEILSEGTLCLMRAAGAPEVSLRGQNVQTPLSQLRKFADRLLRGSRTTPKNVLLVGPPGTGKTVMATDLLRRIGIPGFEILSPKSPLVGETERLAQIQRRILLEHTPCILWSDEISEAMPLQRSDYNGDGGVTQAVTAMLLSVLGDESRKGKSVLIGATNCPYRIAAAVLDRFVVAPVLAPTINDLPEIIVAVATKIDPDFSSKADDPRVLEAARKFYDKRASPRGISKAIENVMAEDSIDSETILFASEDFCNEQATESILFADLWAIKATTNNSFFPWYGRLNNYVFPPHISGAVDPETGSVNRAELDRRIKELEPYANV